jgi:prevent-host-death family protein
MASIGAFDAKTRLSALLERVEKGERFTITRHGKPVAELVPVRARDRARIADTIRSIEDLTRDWTLGSSVQDAIDSGRNR